MGLGIPDLQLYMGEGKSDAVLVCSGRFVMIKADREFRHLPERLGTMLKEVAQKWLSEKIFGKINGNRIVTKPL